MKISFRYDGVRPCVTAARLAFSANHSSDISLSFLRSSAARIFGRFEKFSKPLDNADLICYNEIERKLGTEVSASVLSGESYRKWEL